MYGFKMKLVLVSKVHYLDLALQRTKTRVIRQQQFESTYLYGAIYPNTKQSVGLVLPYANAYCMQLHLQPISDALPRGCHAVLVVNGAVWHHESYSLPNVTILKLPPYSPELNPIEQVWLYVKQHWLSNRCFDNYEMIIDATCKAWLNFTEQSAVVKSLTARN